jgi:hypothetical protein
MAEPKAEYFKYKVRVKHCAYIETSPLGFETYCLYVSSHGLFTSDENGRIWYAPTQVRSIEPCDGDDCGN